jgi:hypothetical protein
MQTTTLDLSADIIDVQDIINRFEELDASLAGEYLNLDKSLDDDRDEHYLLLNILASMVGYGGDTKWRGDWYPGHLIRDCYFTTYAREMLEDCGTVPADLPSWVEIDWDATARNVRIDYTPVTIDGVTYWYR